MQPNASQIEKVDELGRLDAELAAVARKIARQKELRAEVRGWFPDLDAAADVVVAGSQFTAYVGPCTIERFIRDKAGLLRKLTRAVFLEKCSIAIGVLEKLLSDEDLKRFVGEERTGARAVKTVAAVAKAA